jgi:hypothetical protein
VVLRDLARQANMSQATFRSLADRVLNDQHVAYVWLLYNAYVTDGDHQAKAKTANKDEKKDNDKKKGRDAGLSPEMPESKKGTD